MSEQTSFKSMRVLSLYARLQEGQVIKKSELAQEFNVNERSIQRDIEALRDFLAGKLMEQADWLRENGQIDKAIEKENLAERYQEAADKIQPSDVTESEACLATTNPEVFTAKQFMLGQT